ncbi:hypothetical protein P261_01069 [Lachnospiraceae bacterium TWA4]|nr:hypothetical protein P261_01069 [Lachnospiraceae bacterium TWA4]
MTLQNMKYIIEIANQQSISKAAKSLYLSQSTLSTAVKEVESSLGITIFNRTNRGITLTYDGEDFIKYAKEIVQQSDYLMNRYQHRNYIPMRFSVSTQRLPFAVRAFKKLLETLNLSGYDIAIRESPTHLVIRDVAIGKSELGILALHESHLDTIKKEFAINDLVWNELDLLNIYVFIRKEHPLAHRPMLSLEDLKDYAFVTYDQELNSSQYTEEIIFYEILNKNIHVNDRCTKLALIRGYDCFSIGPDLPNSNADTFHKGLGGIVAIPLKESVEPLHVGYISRLNTNLKPMAKDYIDLLKNEISNLADR